MRLIFAFILLNINLLFAGEIITTNDFSLIEKEASRLDGHSLILFDVDATLIVPNDALLKPKGKELFEQLIASYTDRDLFREIRMKAPHSLVDDKSIRLVQNLQQNKIPVIAFTAAPSKVHGVEEPGAWRVDELQRYGFDFSPAFPNSTFLELPKQVGQQHFPLFKSGVLYSSFHPKGDILIVFLQQIGLKPKKVIFVDDELKHVQSVIAALDKQGIPCVGIHYTAANDVPCDLNEEQARVQISYFIQNDVWLSDKESQQLMDFTDFQSLEKN
ncbi:MAG: DUF2608 domain-containing protein [Chlamydiia bacterium]